MQLIARVKDSTLWGLRPLVECSRTLRVENLLPRLRRVAMRQRELQVLRHQLLDVWAADVVDLGKLHDLENLYTESGCGTIDEK